MIPDHDPAQGDQSPAAAPSVATAFMLMTPPPDQTIDAHRVSPTNELLRLGSRCRMGLSVRSTIAPSCPTTSAAGASSACSSGVSQRSVSARSFVTGSVLADL